MLMEQANLATADNFDVSRRLAAAFMKWRSWTREQLDAKVCTCRVTCVFFTCSFYRWL